ncbi:MAG: DDE-type integrase/transposase/recombinase, partial [Thermoplasmata archaeon]|nr:DDE-type integrase/transposase/recombinase [Thermoplasmata archaeon]
VVSDGCGAYKHGVSKHFWDKIRMGKTTYIRKPGLRARYGGDLSNNMIERVHSTLKERIKTMRGFGSHTGATNIMTGLIIHLNFIRPHSSLRRQTPAQATGLKIPTLEHGWGDLIQWAHASPMG